MNNTRKIVLAALFVAIGVVLPQAFHAIPNAGSIFLPMHIPVLVSGFLLGPLYGLITGILTPLLSHLIFTMPPSPILPSMLCELAIYGLTTGIFYRLFKFNNEIINIYLSLICAMLCGRIFYGILNALVFRAGQYSLNAWITSAFVTAIPGIIIQLILIPILIRVLKHLSI